jgi:hypothetical protein
MAYSPQHLPPGGLASGMPRASSATYGSVPASVGGFSATGQVFGAGPTPIASAYPSMANGYRPMAQPPTSQYVPAQPYQTPSTVSAALPAAYRPVQPQYAAARYPVAPIPSPGYPTGAIQRSPTYPASSYLAAHSHNTLNSSLAYPGTTSIPGYAMPAGTSFYAGPPSHHMSPYAASVPTANPYPSAVPGQIGSPVYPGTTPYTMPRP